MFGFKKKKKIARTHCINLRELLHKEMNRNCMCVRRRLIRDYVSASSDKGLFWPHVTFIKPGLSNWSSSESVIRLLTHMLIKMNKEAWQICIASFWAISFLRCFDNAGKSVLGHMRLPKANKHTQNVTIAFAFQMRQGKYWCKALKVAAGEIMSHGWKIQPLCFFSGGFYCLHHVTTIFTHS